MALREEWQGFSAGHWTDDVNVRDFIQRNYTQYDGDESFLAGPTEATDKLWGKVQELQKQERANGGVLDCETEVVSGLTAYGPGYIDPEGRWSPDRQAPEARLHALRRHQDGPAGGRELRLQDQPQV